MSVGRYQTTLPDYELFEYISIVTTPPNYLYTNNNPVSEPTYIANIPPPPPRETPNQIDPPGMQVTLYYYVENACPVCHQPQDNVSEHLLTSHADVVNQRLQELKDSQSQSSEPEYEPRVVPKEPAMYGQVPVNQPGESLTPTNPRDCNTCGTTMSTGYKRIFGWENGDLWCPDCKPRSQRYTNDPARQNGSYSAPENTTGTSNPRYNIEPEPTP